MGLSDAEREVVAATQKVLDSIQAGDYDTYTTLNDANLTAFEPEAGSHLVEGMPFHKYYFEQGQKHPSQLSGMRNNILQPHVRIMGSSAVISYVRCVQTTSKEGQHASSFTQETRVFEKQGGQWKQVHFHRSPAKL